MLILGMGYLLGGGIEGDRKEQAAIDWAVETTKDCEVSYREFSDFSVSDCLEDAIARIEDEKRQEARAERHDPRT
jgi:hypothetical protein